MDNKTVWAMFYAGLVAMKTHPGNKWPAQGQPLKHELDFLAELTDLMVERYRRRFPCPGSPHQS